MGRPYKCPICGGTGTVPAHFYAEYRGTSVYGEVTCKACKGSGIVYDSDHLSWKFGDYY